uniref:Uncharacterized protein n=1 Tax=Trichogramma kaykai TaxID=54128 RepID=A0ABD2W836_9HYME
MHARERRRTISRVCTNSRPLESRTDSRNAHQLKMLVFCSNPRMQHTRIGTKAALDAQRAAMNCMLNQIKHARQGPRERRGGQLCCRSNMRRAFSAGVNMSKVEREREREGERERDNSYYRAR